MTMDADNLTSSLAIDINNQIFTWRRFRNEKTWPHDVYLDPTGHIAVIVLRRGHTRPNGDWAINLSLLNSTAAAVRDGRLKAAYVVQVAREEILGRRDVHTVIANIGNAEPLHGDNGPYHWLDAEFKPVGFNRGVSDDLPW
jgi:hypothetical protein